MTKIEQMISNANRNYLTFRPRITFLSESYSVNERNKTVSCKLICTIPDLEFNYNKDGHNIPENIDKTIIVKGIAKVLPDDIFDVESGKKIARTKAENKAYSKYLHNLSKFGQILKTYNEHIIEEEMKSIVIISHNKNYIESF